MVDDEVRVFGALLQKHLSENVLDFLHSNVPLSAVEGSFADPRAIADSILILARLPQRNDNAADAAVLSVLTKGTTNNAANLVARVFQELGIVPGDDISTDPVARETFWFGWEFCIFHRSYRSAVRAAPVLQCLV